MTHFDAQKPSVAGARKDRVFGFSPFISDVPYTCARSGLAQLSLGRRSHFRSLLLLFYITYPARVLEMRSYTQ